MEKVYLWTDERRHEVKKLQLEKLNKAREVLRDDFFQIFNLKHDQFFKAEIDLQVAIEVKINNQKKRNPHRLGIVAVSASNMEKVVSLLKEDFTVAHAKVKGMIPRAYEFQLPAEYKLDKSMGLLKLMFAELMKRRTENQMPLTPGLEKYK